MGLGLHAMVFDRRKRHPITTKCRPCIERSCLRALLFAGAPFSTGGRVAVQGSAIWKRMPGYLGAICICLGLHAMVFDRRKRHPITTKCRPCIERSWWRPFLRALHFQREAGWPYRGVRYGRECPVIWALSAYVRDRHAARESPSILSIYNYNYRFLGRESHRRRTFGMT